ncbi:MAG TPA: FAD:protein FMN transferase, partial [Azospirillaceae bacterium]|nr:FAD:protein FMN transferase [Azospirillaceae bacterium]
MMSPFTRRRFIAVSAAFAGLAARPGWALASAKDVRTWRGTALGADASIQLHHPDRAEADRLIHVALDEVERL